MRREFELLDSCFRQLYANTGINLEFLRMVREHIELCDSIVETDKERAIIVRTRHWWVERAEPLKVSNMLPEYKPPTPAQPSIETPNQETNNKLELTDSDKRFLRSLRISPPED